MSDVERTGDNEESPAERLVGKVLAGRYEVTGVLGEGGMGVVLRAKQIAMNREVALKLLHPSFSANRHAVARFHREMQITARLEHPHTIRVYDFGETEDHQLYLAMELVPGRTLSRVLRTEGRLELPRLVHIAAQVARALKAAHGEGIVHRDLKPDNVMLLDRYGERDVVKVLDFGIARFADDGAADAARLTAEGAVVGTPAYMSPEQATGRPVGPATDLYAFGVMLFEMATGEVPFTAPTTVGLMVKHVQEAPRRPSELADVDPRLELLILACLEKAPEQRPRSAAEVLAALETLAPGGAPGVLAAETKKEPRGATTMGQIVAATEEAEQVAPRRPGRALLWLGLGGVVAAAGVVAALALGGGRSERPEASAGAGPDALAAAPDATPSPDAAPSPRQDASSTAPSAREDAASAAPRAALELVYTTTGEPAPPERCTTRDAQLVAALASAGDLLARRPPGQGNELDLKALEALDAEAKARPDAVAGSAEAQALMARALLRTVDLPSVALPWAKRAVELCPEWALAQGVLGNVAQAMTEYPTARAAYEAATKSAPGWGVPRFNLALVDLAEGRPKDALAALDALLRDHPEWPQGHLLRAQARLATGDAAERPAALADAQRATELAPTRAEAWFLLGEARRALGEGDARAAYCKAKELGYGVEAERCP